MATIQELDRRAVEVSRAIVANVRADALDAPTPCAAWDLGALLAHMTVQHHGFARAVAGERTEITDWQPIPVADDPVGHYGAAVDHVIESFAAVPTPPGENTAFLPEIRGGVTVPVILAMGFHFVDYVVHSWDVAATLGLPVEFDDDVLAMALVVAGQVPDDPVSRGPDKSFVRALPDTGDQTRPLDRVLRKLGRSPNWPG